MKKIIRDFVKQLGGTTAYSGKTKTMYIRGKHTYTYQEGIAMQFKNLPFNIVICHT